MDYDRAVEVHIQQMEAIHQEAVLQITPNKVKIKEQHDQVRRVELIRYNPGEYIWYNTLGQGKAWRYKGWWIGRYKELEDTNNMLYNLSTNI